MTVGAENDWAHAHGVAAVAEVDEHAETHAREHGDRAEIKDKARVSREVVGTECVRNLGNDDGCFSLPNDGAGDASDDSSRVPLNSDILGERATIRVIGCVEGGHPIFFDR